MLYNFLDLLMNNFLVLLLSALGVILIWCAISNLLQKKYGAGGIFALLGAIAVAFSMSIKNSKQSKKEKEIKEIDDKIKDKKDELKDIDNKVEQNKQEAEELEKKEEAIKETLNEELKEAEAIKPIEVKTDEDVLNAFDFAANHNKPSSKP